MPNLLESDFYFFQEALSAPEQEAVLALREYMETSVRPIADGCWSRAEFPMEVVKPLAELGLLGAPWPETRHFENSAVYRG